MAMRWNNAEFQKLAHSSEVADACKGYAEKVAGIARSTAPVDTGAYAGSIGVEILDRPTRVTAQVVAADPKSLIIESRTGNLARALGQVRSG